MVHDPATGEAAIVDPVLDFDPNSGRTSTLSTDADKVLIPPSIPDEKAKEMSPHGCVTIKPCLRMVQAE